MNDEIAQYGVAAYGNMILDKVRLAAFEAALRQAITPASIVLDIGTGTGIMAMMAVQFGAKHVYAIEPAGAITVAQQIAQDNNLADRITFIQDTSTNITLPHKAHIIVSDLRGVLPLLQHHIPTLTDARTRHLAPHGLLIPQQDTLWAAPVTAPTPYQTLIQPWADSPYGLNMSAAQNSVLNSWMAAKVKPEAMLAPAQQWATLDYTTRTNPNVKGQLHFEVTHPGRGHGLLLWFNMHLAPNIHITNAPTAPQRAQVYGSGFFPWQTPLDLQQADTLTVTLQASLIGGEYIWRWQTHAQRAGQTIAHFNQSTFFSAPLTRTTLHKHESRYTPTPTPESHIDQIILAHCNGQNTLQQIAQTLSQAYPAEYPRWQTATGRVNTLLQRYNL